MNTQQQLKKTMLLCQSQLQLPQFNYIRQYLNNRYITNEMIEYYELGFGKFYGSLWIVVPIKDINDNVILLKLRREPKSDNKIKYIAFPRNIPATIFGMQDLLNTDMIAVVEGECDKMLLSSHGVPTITSTVGSQGFKKAWIFIFKNIKKVFLIFDRDEAGNKGAEKLSNMILGEYPDIEVFKCVLPIEVGEHGDISDLAKINNGHIDIDKLLYKDSFKMQLKIKPKEEVKKYTKSNYNGGEITQEDISTASKTDCSKFVKIEKIIGNIKWAKCPFHKEKTASFACYPDGRGYSCYGCGASSDCIDLIQKLYGIGFVEAVKYILNK